MSRKTIRRLLWAGLVLALPIPYYLGGTEFAPLARLLFLSSLVSWVIASEGAGGYQASFLQLALVQSLLWLLLLWAASAIAAAAVHALAPARARAPVVALALIGLVGAGCFEIYRTDLSSRSAHSSLAGLFD